MPLTHICNYVSGDSHPEHQDDDAHSHVEGAGPWSGEDEGSGAHARARGPCCQIVSAVKAFVGRLDMPLTSKSAFYGALKMISELPSPKRKSCGGILFSSFGLVNLLGNSSALDSPQRCRLQAHLRVNDGGDGIAELPRGGGNVRPA